MVDLQFTDFHNFVEILLEFKMNVEDLILPVPNFLIEEKAQEHEQLVQVLVALHHFLCNFRRL